MRTAPALGELALQAAVSPAWAALTLALLLARGAVSRLAPAG